MKKKITIRFKIGTVNAFTNKESFSESKCRLCGGKIYFVQAIGMNKFPATLLSDGTYSLHSLVCPDVQKREREKELSKMNKIHVKKNKKEDKSFKE